MPSVILKLFTSEALGGPAAKAYFWVNISQKPDQWKFAQNFSGSTANRFLIESKLFSNLLKDSQGKPFSDFDHFSYSGI